VAEGEPAHHCEYREEAERLRGELADIKATLDKLNHAVFGKKSEKLPRVEEQLRGGAAKPREETLTERRAKRAAKEELPERRIKHVVPEAKRLCPKCGSSELRPLGDGKTSIVYEYIPARIERQVHVQETLSCRCGEGIVTAEAPKAIEKGRYGPGLIAHVVTAKCCDSIPIYRQAKALARTGVPINRTTLNDLFHAAARAAEPLYKRLLELIRIEEYVRADETPQRVLDKGKTRRGYVWTFRTEKLIAYVHSHGRNGEVAMAVLGKTKGYLQVDAYSGYNNVTVPDQRVRVGCWAHVRRRFHEALSTAPEARAMLDLILSLYRVEAEADRDAVSDAERLRRRRSISAELVDDIATWLRAEQPKHLPKSPIGEAIRYALGQWDALTRFLSDARLELDNNASERALRTIALGRKNYLFVGNDEAGENLAGLTSLLATCEANGINPEVYLADVLMRVSTHPNARLDELLPHLWNPSTTVDSS
jgi:transposase